MDDRPERRFHLVPRSGLTPQIDRELESTARRLGIRVEELLAMVVRAYVEEGRLARLQREDAAAPRETERRQG